jgi:hypothetical protein
MLWWSGVICVNTVESPLTIYLESGFLCMDGDNRKNPHVGQFTDEECYGGVVLYV